MILTGENLSTGREKLYSVGVRPRGPTIDVSVSTISIFAATNQNLGYIQVSEEPFL